MRGVFLNFGTVSNGDLDPAPLARAVPGLVIHGRTPQPEVAARMAKRQRRALRLFFEMRRRRRIARDFELLLSALNENPKARKTVRQVLRVRGYES